MTTISQNFYQNRYEISDGHWLRYATAPSYVKRPHLGELYAYYYLWDYQNGFKKKDMDNIWSDIQWATKSGFLGYCGGYSNDSEVIAVHISDPTDTLLSIIKDNLHELGVRNIHLKFKEREVLHYSQHPINESDVNNENNFDFKELLLFREFQELQQNRQKYY